MITCEDCGKQLDYGGRGRPPKYCPAHAKASKRRLDRARPNGGRIRKEYPKCCRDAQAAGVEAYGREAITYQDWVTYRLVTQHWNVVYYEPPIEHALVSGAHVRKTKARTCAQHAQFTQQKRQSRMQALSEQAAIRDEKASLQVAIWGDNPMPVMWTLADAVASDVSESYRVGNTASPDEYMPADNGLETLAGSGSKSGYDAETEEQARRYLAKWGWVHELVSATVRQNLVCEVLYAQDERGFTLAA